MCSTTSWPRHGFISTTPTLLTLDQQGFLLSFTSLKKLQNEINARSISIISHPELLQAGDGLRGVGGQQVVQQAQADEGGGE